MKFWSVAILTSGLFLACSKEATLEQHVVLYPNNSIWKSWYIQRTPQGDTLIQGAFKEFYWNGSPSQVTQYKDGVKDGSSQAWYDKGNLKWAKTYKQGKRAEVWRLYSSDGRPRVQVGFVEGLLQDTVKVWDKNDTAIVNAAQYAKGQCVSGTCGALDSLQSAPPGTKPGSPDRADADLIQAFLE